VSKSVVLFLCINAESQGQHAGDGGQPTYADPTHCSYPDNFSFSGPGGPEGIVVEHRGDG